MSSAEILDYRLTQDSVDAEEFKQFVEDLLPQLMPFDGTNPNSIVILDNCAVHNVDGVLELLQEHGLWYTSYHRIHWTIIQLRRLFSKVKCTLTSMETALRCGLLDLHTCMAAAFADITSDDCQAG